MLEEISDTPESPCVTDNRTQPRVHIDADVPMISIIICTHGRCKELQSTLTSLSSVVVPEHISAELLVVENGTKGEAESLIKEFGHDRIQSRYIFQSELGKSRALNLSLTHSSGNILLFTDDDVRFPRNWLIEMCEPLIDGRADVVVGGCRLAPYLLRDWMTPYHRGFLASTEYLSDVEPSEFAGVNVACLRGVFSTVPLFDCELGGGGLGNCEDSLFARQLKKAGYRFASRTRTWIEHHPAESRLLYGSWIRAAENRGRSLAYLAHHWCHERNSLIGLRLCYLRCKLALRILINGRRSVHMEGIAAWELSYKTEIAKLSQLLHEQSRPRNYQQFGFTKRSVGY